MRGLYICAGQDLSDKTSGISKKILMQINTLKESGFDLNIINLDNKSGQNFFENIKFILPFSISKYENRIISLQNNNINWDEIDFVYIRRLAFCRGFELLIKKIKIINNKTKIFIEFPTYPFINEYSGVKIVLSWMAMYYLKILYKYVDYIITYSRDKEIYGIPTINISNGVNINEIKEKKESNSKSINMIAVALFSKWHGYDRLIEGLNNYYKRNTFHKDIHLYLIGSGEYLSSYINLVNKYKLNKVIHILGAKYGTELDNIYDKCNIAIDALGRHRSGVFYNSSLKGKEYCAKGLPIVSGVETELDYINNYKYYLRVPSNDSPIDINEIIKFYKSVYDDEKEIQVIQNIRKFCKDNFEFKITYKPVIEKITSI